jgi:SAM-dependent methyltransferase
VSLNQARRGQATVSVVPSPDQRAMSFGAIADDYDRLRPGPPDAALDWLLPADCRVAVDVGAGTGLLTRALARRVARVVAVEPDPRMRAVLRARSPGVEAVAGTGEAIPLPDASADAVLVSSAWHWMDPDRAVPEVTRVLRDGGRFGVLWTSRDREVGWLRELRWPGPPAADADAGPPDAGRRPRTHAVALPEGAPLRDIMTQTFRFTLTMSVTSLVDLLGTYSGVITASPRDRKAALAHARAALEQRFPGASLIEVPMRSWCWRADRLPRR